MRVTVIGAGAVGGWLAATLARGGAEVALVARGATLDRVRAHGLTLLSGEQRATYRLAAAERAHDLPKPDAVVLAVKTHAFADAVAASGRSRSEVEINLWHVVAPNPDRAESVNDAKRHVAIYAAIAQYQPYFAAHGFGTEAGRLAEAVAAGQRNLVDLVPDEMARTFVVCGTTGEVAGQLEPMWEVADSLCLQPPPVAGEQRRAYDTTIAETFYR